MAHAEASSGDLALLAAYRATEWIIHAPRQEHRLRRGVLEPPKGLALPAGIITAYNPASSLGSVAENEAANARLREILRAVGADLLPTLAVGTGESDGAWDEPGFTVRTADRAVLQEIARDFGQNAIVWITSSNSASLVVTRPGFCGYEFGALLEF